MYQPVVFEYEEIANRDNVLHDKIKQAYGPDGVGLCLVKNVPKYTEYRSSLLPLGHQLANLPQEKLDKLTRPELFYSSGWSHGKEQFRGRVDTSKGSFYGFPLNDTPITQLDGNLAEKGGVIQRNIWPTEDIPTFEQSFKDLGRLMSEVGALLAYHIDKYVKSVIPAYEMGQMEGIIKNGNQHVGRFLHYFSSDEQKLIEDDWCGWHNDFSVLTGLAASMYTNKSGEVIEDFYDPEGGLFVKSRNSEKVRVKIPSDCLAFQSGEVAQIVSGGLIVATPHCIVRGPKSIGTGIARNNFVNFLSPNQSFEMRVPEGVDPNTVANMECYYVTKLKDRWSQGMNYGEFSLNSLKSIRY
ncbi:hypothetical protein ABPG74_007192 [Tetrahymena malaccensis]